MNTCAAYETNRPTWNFGRPKCPHCGNMLLVAEESAFSLKGRISHAWSCDDCGHEFVTSITLWAR